MNVSYTAVVLEPEDRRRLLDSLSGVLEHLKPSGFNTLKPDGDLVCHHMTCNMGACPPAYRPFLGTDVILTVTHWGVSDKVLAAKVDPNWDGPIKSANAVPHVTLAVNWEGGGKPKHSNEIVTWFKLDESLVVMGKFQEVFH